MADGANNYVQAFSPATSQRYSRAWQDLQASIGEQLVPVVEGATAVVRWFADTTAGLTPIIAPLVDTCMTEAGDAWGALGDVFREMFTQGVLVAEAFAPLVPLFAEIAFGPMRAFTEGLRLIADFMKRANENMADFFGMETPQFNGSSFGKSAVPASTTSVSQLITSANNAAFGAARGIGETKKDPASLLGAIEEGIRNAPSKNAKAFVDELLNRVPGLRMLGATSGGSGGGGNALGTAVSAAAGAVGMPPVREVLREMANDARKQAGRLFGQ